MTNRNIAKELKISYGTMLLRFWNKLYILKIDNTPEKRITSDCTNKYIYNFSYRNRKATAIDIQKDLHNFCDVNISVRTVRNWLIERGLNGRVTRKKTIHYSEKMTAIMGIYV